jgi:phosphosulfolactate synthase
MNFNLSKIPERTTQPRDFGITMISDRGLNLAETENMLSVAASHIDMVKLAFGTAMVTPLLREKIQIYKSHNIPVFFGGLLFEAFIIRNQFDDYIKMLDDYDITFTEVSDGDIKITHEKKCEYIRTLSTRGVVISEIGSQDKDKVKVTPPYIWIELMKAELDAGSRYVIAEAKETGNEGLYRNNGEVREGLVQEILTKIPSEKIIWEAPEKDQQLYFIKLLGCNANLGNILPKEIIPLEAMRLGLRGDSFDFFLNDKQDRKDSF